MDHVAAHNAVVRIEAALAKIEASKQNPTVGMVREMTDIPKALAQIAKELEVSGIQRMLKGSFAFAVCFR